MVMPTFRKYFFSFLLFISIIFLPVLSSQAQPPEVNNPLENRLYKGSVDEITAFISQLQAEIEQIIIEIDKTVDKNAGQEIQNSATVVKDLFQGLSLQNKILLTELSRTLSTPLNQPIIEGPPYSVQNFDKIIAFQRQVGIQQTESSKRFTFLQHRLISLKESAVGQLSEYAKLMKTNADNHLLLYERYGKLLNLQIEYALLKTKKPKLEKQLTELNEGKKTAAKWVKDAFTNLTVTPGDIQQAQQLKDKRQTLFKNKTEATSAEYQDLNSRVLIYEAQLDEALGGLETAKEKDLTQEGLRIEKERIELILDALKLRIRLINQTRLNCEIKILKSNFRLQWLKNYELEGEQNRLTDFIKEWSQEVDKLDRKQGATTTSISTVTLARSSLTQKLVTIHNQKDAARTPQLLDALATLTRQADKVNDNIDKLILALSENDQDIRNAKREIEQIIDLIRFAISRSERIRVWCRMSNLKAPSGLKSDYYFALFRKFKEAGIVIPFPQHDLHLQTASPELTEKLRKLMTSEDDSAKTGTGTVPSKDEQN